MRGGVLAAVRLRNDADHPWVGSTLAPAAKVAAEARRVAAEVSEGLLVASLPAERGSTRPGSTTFSPLVDAVAAAWASRLGVNDDAASTSRDVPRRRFPLFDRVAIARNWTGACHATLGLARCVAEGAVAVPRGPRGSPALRAIAVGFGAALAAPAATLIACAAAGADPADPAADARRREAPAAEKRRGALRGGGATSRGGGGRTARRRRCSRVRRERARRERARSERVRSILLLLLLLLLFARAASGGPRGVVVRSPVRRRVPRGVPFVPRLGGSRLARASRRGEGGARVRGRARRLVGRRERRPGPTGRGRGGASRGGGFAIVAGASFFRRVRVPPLVLVAERKPPRIGSGLARGRSGAFGVRSERRGASGVRGDAQGLG